MVTTALLVLFVVRARHTQRWLHAHPRSANRLGLMFGLQKVLEERHLWLFRTLFGPIPLLMWVVSVVAVYCFFHGSELPRR
jgi:hypothetical protein